MSLYQNNEYAKDIQDVYSKLNEEQSDFYNKAGKLLQVISEARNSISSEDITNYDLVNKIWSRIESTMMAEGLLTEENLDNIKELIVAIDKQLSKLS